MPIHILQKMNASRCESPADEPSESFDITPADRSKAMSQSRITLNSTLNVLEKILTADSLNEQRFKRARIEQCLNSKTWKAEKSLGARASKGLARFDSTIESSDDYKLFLEKRTRTEEDRLNRPKPVAGGIIDGTNVQANNSENGTPMSALLLHLRAKREQESRKRREPAKPRLNSGRPSISSTKTEKNSNSEKDYNNPKRKSKGSASREKGTKSEVNSIKSRGKNDEK